MSTPIEAWIAQRKHIIRQKAIERHLLMNAEEQPIPDRLRPATPEDIQVGNIIWYKDGDDGPFWQLIEEVRNPSDDWKAYTGHDGCRYGLDGAFVEVV